MAQIYAFRCDHDECKVQHEDGRVEYLTHGEMLVAHHSEYHSTPFPECPKGHGPMVRVFFYGGVTNRSKGVFPCDMPDLETPEFGDSGPVRVEDYQDYKRKLKERGLRERVPTRDTVMSTKGARWL